MRVKVMVDLQGVGSTLLPFENVNSQKIPTHCIEHLRSDGLDFGGRIVATDSRSCRDRQDAIFGAGRFTPVRVHDAGLAPDDDPPAARGPDHFLYEQVFLALEGALQRQVE